MKISVISPTPRFLLAGPPFFSSIWLSCIPTFMFMFHVHACPQAFRWTPNDSAFLYHLANAHRGATSLRVFPGWPKPRLPCSRVLLPALLPPSLLPICPRLLGIYFVPGTGPAIPQQTRGNNLCLPGTDVLVGKDKNKQLKLVFLSFFFFLIGWWQILRTRKDSVLFRLTRGLPTEVGVGAQAMWGPGRWGGAL